MTMIPRVSVTSVIALSVLSLATPALSAQRLRPMVPDLKSSTTLGAGYVVNAPRSLVGFSVLALTPKLLGGAGVYADVKFSHSTPADAPEYLDNLTVEQVEITYEDDHAFEGRSVWVSVDLAAVYSASRELGVYVGGGYSRERHYEMYFDRTETRGLGGFYWVRDERESGDRFNLMGGLLMHAARHLLIQIGMETRPLGGTVGFMLILPL